MFIPSNEEILTRVQHLRIQRYLEKSPENYCDENIFHVCSYALDMNTWTQ